jgi:hypothetical protein
MLIKTLFSKTVQSLVIDADRFICCCIVYDEPPIIAPITTDYCSRITLIQPLGSDSDGLTSVRYINQIDKL